MAQFDLRRFELGKSPCDSNDRLDNLCVGKGLQKARADIASRTDDDHPHGDVMPQPGFLKQSSHAPIWGSPHFETGSSN
jgi:hypothetical protein